MSFMFCTVIGCDCQLVIKENYDDDYDDDVNTSGKNSTRRIVTMSCILSALKVTAPDSCMRKEDEL